MLTIYWVVPCKLPSSIKKVEAVMGLVRKPLAALALASGVPIRSHVLPFAT